MRKKKKKMKMMMATQSSSVAALLVATLMLSTGCWAFPNGGPIDACVKQRANQPNHGSHQPQPEETNPFVIEASGENYQPGQVITGELLLVALLGFYGPSVVTGVRFASRRQ